jgi:hypothetical protein
MGGGYGGGYKGPFNQGSGQGGLPGNISKLSKDHPIDEKGRFGKPDRGLEVNVVTSSNPIETAKEFLKVLSNKAEKIPLPNRKGYRLKYSETAWVVFRPVSASGGPAIEFYFGKNNPANYKVHFEKQH